MAPANDNLANPLELVGPHGTILTTTFGATNDTPYDPLFDYLASGDNSVWYKLAVPAGWVDSSTRLRIQLMGLDDPGIQQMLLFSATTYPPTSSGDWTVLAQEPDLIDYTGTDPASGWFYLGVQADTRPADFLLTWQFDNAVSGLSVAFMDEWNEPDPLWVRLDDPATDSAWRLRVNQVTVDRGTDSETDTTKTGTLAASCHDPYGMLDPTNHTGPFWDSLHGETFLNPNLQVAFARHNPVDGTWSTRFRGFVKAFRHTLDTSGFAQVTLEAVDAFEMFADLRMTPGDQGDTPPDDSEGDIYFEGGSTTPAEDVFKHVDQRIVQALDDVGWPGAGVFRDPTVLRDIFSGNVTVQAEVYERDGQIVEVMTDAADAEFPDVSRLFVSREGVISFRGRFARFFPENPGYGIGNWELGGAAQAEADSDVVMISDLTFRRSKEDIINVALALPKGISDANVPAQQVEDTTSIAKYGRRPWITDNLLTWEGHDEDGDPVTAADETKKFATFKVDNFKDPKTRVEQITVKWRHPDSFSGPAAWQFLQEVELGDLIHLETTHQGGGGFDEDFFVEAIMETDTPGPDADTHVVVTQLNVSPRSFYSENPFGEFDLGNS